MAKPTEVPGLGPKTPLATAGPLLVAARLGDVRRHEESAALLDADAVHDMRVATRRLRAALKLFAGEGGRAVDREVKRLQDALGAVRGVQVQLAWLTANERRLHRRERALLRAWLVRPLARDADALRAALRTWEAEGAGEVEAAAAGATLASRLGGKRMRRRLQKRTRKVRRLARGVREGPDPRAAHELRIAAKKLRYAAELLEPAFAGRVEPLLEALVPLQESLGALHDVDERIDRLGRLARRGSALERRAARRLLALLGPERERLAGELVAELGDLSAP